MESIQAAVRNARRSRVPLNFSQLITTILDTLEKGGHTEAVRNFRRFLDFDRVKAESVLRTIVNPVQRILRHKNRRRSHVAHLKIKSKVMKRLVHSAVRPYLLGFLTPLFAYSRCSRPCCFLLVLSNQCFGTDAWRFRRSHAHQWPEIHH